MTTSRIKFLLSLPIEKVTLVVTAKKAPPTMDTAMDISDSTTPRPFLDLPREIRDLIYTALQNIQNQNENQFTITLESLRNFPAHCSTRSLTLMLPNPLCLTNKQIATEFIEQLFLTQTVRFSSGPARLHEFLHGRTAKQLSMIKKIEVDWKSMPYDLLDRLSDFEESEIIPLFNFLRDFSTVASITVPLRFLDNGSAVSRHVRGSAEVRLVRKERENIWRYWVSVIFYALHVLVHGPASSPLREVVVRYQPYDTWALLEPAVNVRNLVGKKPSEWNERENHALAMLGKSIPSEEWGYGLDELLHDVVIRPWSGEGGLELGEEALLRFRKPDGNTVDCIVDEANQETEVPEREQREDGYRRIIRPERARIERAWN